MLDYSLQLPCTLKACKDLFSLNAHKVFDFIYYFYDTIES